MASHNSAAIQSILTGGSCSRKINRLQNSLNKFFWLFGGKKVIMGQKTTHNQKQAIRIVMKKQARNNKESHVLREDWQRRSQE
jgi:hypothetical protein